MNLNIHERIKELMLMEPSQPVVREYVPDASIQRASDAEMA